MRGKRSNRSVAAAVKPLGAWSVDEDARLRAAVFRHGGKKWKAIAMMVPRRSPAQCSARWSQLQNLHDAVKSPWTAPEDARMSELVGMYGPGRWAVVSSCMPGRNGKQCRERWHNQLNPAIKKDAWTPDEDETIIALQAALGNAWAKIAEALPGRTDNAVKNRWHASLTKPTARRTKSTKRHAPASTSTASGSSSGTRPRRPRRSSRRAGSSAKRPKQKERLLPPSCSGGATRGVASPTGVDADVFTLPPACECKAPSSARTDAIASDSSGMLALLVGTDPDANANACAFHHMDTSDAFASSALSATDGRLRMCKRVEDDDDSIADEPMATSALADCLLFTPSFALYEPPATSSCALLDASASLFAPHPLKVEPDASAAYYDSDDALFAAVWRGSSVLDAGADVLPTTAPLAMGIGTEVACAFERALLVDDADFPVLL